MNCGSNWSIGGKTNLICNWSKQVQVNNPLP